MFLGLQSGAEENIWRVPNDRAAADTTIGNFGNIGITSNSEADREEIGVNSANQIGNTSQSWQCEGVWQL